MAKLMLSKITILILLIVFCANSFYFIQTCHGAVLTANQQDQINKNKYISNLEENNGNHQQHQSEIDSKSKNSHHSSSLPDLIDDNGEISSLLTSSLSTDDELVNDRKKYNDNGKEQQLKENQNSLISKNNSTPSTTTTIITNEDKEKNLINELLNNQDDAENDLMGHSNEDGSTNKSDSTNVEFSHDKNNNDGLNSRFHYDLPSSLSSANRDENLLSAENGKAPVTTNNSDEDKENELNFEERQSSDEIVSNSVKDSESDKVDIEKKSEDKLDGKSYIKPDKIDISDETQQKIGDNKSDAKFETDKMDGKSKPKPENKQFDIKSEIKVEEKSEHKIDSIKPEVKGENKVETKVNQVNQESKLTDKSLMPELTISNKSSENKPEIVKSPEIQGNSHEISHKSPDIKLSSASIPAEAPSTPIVLIAISEDKIKEMIAPSPAQPNETTKPVESSPSIQVVPTSVAIPSQVPPVQAVPEQVKPVQAEDKQLSVVPKSPELLGAPVSSEVIKTSSTALVAPTDSPKSTDTDKIEKNTKKPCKSATTETSTSSSSSSSSTTTTTTSRPSRRSTRWPLLPPTRRRPIIPLLRRRFRTSTSTTSIPNIELSTTSETKKLTDDSITTKIPMVSSTDASKHEEGTTEKPESTQKRPSFSPSFDSGADQDGPSLYDFFTPSTHNRRRHRHRHQHRHRFPGYGPDSAHHHHRHYYNHHTPSSSGSNFGPGLFPSSSWFNDFVGIGSSRPFSTGNPGSLSPRDFSSSSFDDNFGFGAFGSSAGPFGSRRWGSEVDFTTTLDSKSEKRKKPSVFGSRPSHNSPADRHHHHDEAPEEPIISGDDILNSPTSSSHIPTRPRLSSSRPSNKPGSGSSAFPSFTNQPHTVSDDNDKHGFSSFGSGSGVDTGYHGHHSHYPVRENDYGASGYGGGYGQEYDREREPYMPVSPITPNRHGGPYGSYGKAGSSVSGPYSGSSSAIGSGRPNSVWSPADVIVSTIAGASGLFGISLFGDRISPGSRTAPRFGTSANFSSNYDKSRRRESETALIERREIGPTTLLALNSNLSPASAESSSIESELAKPKSVIKKQKEKEKNESFVDEISDELPKPDGVKQVRSEPEASTITIPKQVGTESGSSMTSSSGSIQSATKSRVNRNDDLCSSLERPLICMFMQLHKHTHKAVATAANVAATALSSATSPFGAWLAPASFESKRIVSL